MAKRMLIVDDEEAIRELLKKFFRQEGFEVWEARNGTETLKLVKRKKFDVVLTDLKMPGLDGLGVLEKIRETSSTTAVLILTGYPTSESTVRALELSSDGYVTKPINLDQLKNLVMRALALRRWETRHKGEP
jgi:two-component system response regulator PilR (NtrC family)